MKVTGPSGPSAPSARKPAGRSGAAFRPSDQATYETAAPSGTTPLAAVDALIALQADEGGQGGDARQKAFVRADALLDMLDAIRLGLLAGGIPKARLQALSHAVAAQRESSNDPKLEELMKEIELRAKVEVAKLDALT